MRTVGNYLDWSGQVEGAETPCGGPEEVVGCKYRQTMYGIVIDFSKRNNMLYALIGREMTLLKFELTWAPDLLNYGTLDSDASRESYQAGFDLHYGENLEDVMNVRGYSMQEPGSWTQREWPSPESSEDGLTCVGQSLLEDLIK